MITDKPTKPTTETKEQTSAGCDKTLMLGTVYRFQPIQSSNFMQKWVEVTEAGLTYFKHASNDRP